MLSVLLVIQIAAVALYGWPGFMVGGGKYAVVRDEKAIVSTDNASITLSGVHDVNPKPH